jgi:hypothetical protein
VPTQTDEFVAIPQTPYTDLVDELMERVALPDAAQKCASAGIPVRNREELVTLLATGSLVVEKIAASRAFDFQGHFAKTAAGLGQPVAAQPTQEQVQVQAYDQDLIGAVVADESLAKSASALFAPAA